MAQKKVEKLLIREFLENVLGMTIRRLQGRSPPRADARAVIKANGRDAVLEIELTEYHVDRPCDQKGGSPGARLNSFWGNVRESLYRRLTRKPINVEVLVTLDDASAVKADKARAFAEELVRFARGFDFPPPGTCTITVFKPQFPRMAEYMPSSEDFIVRDLRPNFPLLAEFVTRLILTKVSYHALHWTCTNASAAMVGLSIERVKADVQKKANKAYKWGKNAEKWLLICASGGSIVGTAGPQPAPETWQDEELLATCSKSPFHRIYFWDRPHRWQKRLLWARKRGRKKGSGVD
jgi:hypothetical protein